MDKTGKLFAPSDLINVKWLWQHVEKADGTIYVPFKTPTHAPHIRFSAIEAINEHKGKLSYSGNMGCNHFGGAYFANVAREIFLFNGFSTYMDCDEPAMTSEGMWWDISQSIGKYERDGDTLRLYTMANDVVVFSAEPALRPESTIYLRIMDKMRQAGEILVVSDSVNPLNWGLQIESQIASAFAGLHQQPTDDVIGAFVAAQDGEPIDFEYYNDSHRLTTITLKEYEQLRANGGWPAIEQTYPTVGCVFTFSKIGLRDEKFLVYYNVQNRDFERSKMLFLGTNVNWKSVFSTD